MPFTTIPAAAPIIKIITIVKIGLSVFPRVKATQVAIQPDSIKIPSPARLNLFTAYMKQKQRPVKVKGTAKLIILPILRGEVSGPRTNCFTINRGSLLMTISVNNAIPYEMAIAERILIISTEISIFLVLSLAGLLCLACLLVLPSARLAQPDQNAFQGIASTSPEVSSPSIPSHLMDPNSFSAIPQIVSAPPTPLEKAPLEKKMESEQTQHQFREWNEVPSEHAGFTNN